MLAHRLHLLFCLILVVLSGCVKRAHPEYRIGVDPTWYPLILESKENSVTAFSTELLQKIGQEESIAFTKVTVSWNTLLEGLKKGEYTGILSSIFPYSFNEELFDFSDIYLNTGPVLVVSTGSPFTSFEQLAGKEIAVMPESDGIAFLEKYPHILIRPYPSPAEALNDLSKGRIDGALIDVLIANAYCQDLYRGRLQIATAPLTRSGLRLLTLREQAPILIEAFNTGLNALRSSKEYEQLLQKWHLSKNS